jgi:hypothetical protein
MPRARHEGRHVVVTTAEYVWTGRAQYRTSTLSVGILSLSFLLEMSLLTQRYEPKLLSLHRPLRLVVPFVKQSSSLGLDDQYASSHSFVLQWCFRPRNDASPIAFVNNTTPREMRKSIGDWFRLVLVLVLLLLVLCVAMLVLPVVVMVDCFLVGQRGLSA